MAIYTWQKDVYNVEEELQMSSKTLQGKERADMKRSYHYDPGSGYQYNPNPQRPPRRNGGWNDWVGIAVLFLLPLGVTQIVALVWLVSKIRDMVNQRGQGYAFQARQAAQFVKDQADAAFRQGHGWNPAATRGKDLPVSMVKMVAGAALAVIFGLGAVGAAATFVESLLYGYFFDDELVGVVLSLLLCAGGLGLFFSGREQRRRMERYTNYLAYIGANRQVSLAPMAAAMDVSVRRLTRDLRKMLATHVLPTGYLDMKAGKLMLTEMGYTEQRPEPEPEPEPEAREERTPEDEVLREIQLINDLIFDPVISAKIDRIQEITQKIFQYQKSNPQNSQQLRSFLNYYLPTTLKILRSYARLEAQGVNGENISAAKQHIEGMMDKVVEGFEKQLDRLNNTEAMDIAADVQVLENMLKKDGLSGEDMGFNL